MEVPGRAQDSATEDNIVKSSDEDGKIFCQPCSNDADTTIAIGYCQNCNEYLCAMCLKVHRKQSMSRNHNILEGDNLPNVTLPNVNLNAYFDICIEHVNEVIKYYCSSHDVVGCGDCIVIDHKLCKVDRIQDISPTYFNGDEHQDIKKKVKQFVKSMDEVKEDLQASEKNIKHACEKAVHDIQTFKKEIIDFLDKAEKEMLEMLASRDQRAQSLILKLKQDEKRIINAIQEVHTKIQLQQNQANMLFVEAKKVKSKLCSIEENIEQLKKYVNIDLYEFHRSSRIGQIIDSGLKLGELSMIICDERHLARCQASEEERVTIIAEQTILEEKHVSEMDAYFDCEINIKLHDDSYDCSVNDCVLLSQNQLVIADSGNTCIKIVDVTNKYVSKYKLRSIPHGIAVVNPYMIAVTLPDEGKIQYHAITAGKEIIETDEIKVDKGCSKIAIYENKIIGIFKDSVEILSMSGQKMKSISLPKLTYLMDIAVVPLSQFFYVSNSSYNYMHRCVYKFNFSGNMIATYEDNELEDVMGLEITSDGTLLACNWVRDGCIHMITPDCKKIKKILMQNEHVNYPRCVVFCNETNKLILANNTYFLNGKVKNVLKVFQFR